MKSNKDLLYKGALLFFLLAHFPLQEEDTLNKAIPYYVLLILIGIDMVSYLINFFKEATKKAPSKKVEN